MRGEKGEDRRNREGRKMEDGCFCGKGNVEKKKTRPDTRHKMRQVCVLFTFENNTGLRTYGPTDQRTDTTSYRDATAHLKNEADLAES